jgi:ComF family protein
VRTVDGVWRTVLDDVGRLVFPVPCVACGAPPAAAAPLCEECRAALVPARPGPAPLGCDRLVAAFEYSGPGRELVARIKYRDARHGLTFVADHVAALLAGLPAGAVVSWPPTTAIRRRARGFDHAEALARRVARELGHRPVALLARVDATAQTGRAASERRAGPAFAVRAGVVVPPAVVLVDDIVTTGATLTAAARVLRARGCTSLIAATAARTPPPGSR